MRLLSKLYNIFFTFIFFSAPFLAIAQNEQTKISLGEVAESGFVDIKDDSWVLREAFFAQEYNADIVDYGSLLSDDCAFETGDDEFEAKRKAPYYAEIRKNKSRIYRIMTTITGNDITYDFGRKGYVFPKGFSVWDNEYYGDEAGKFFFERNSYIPITESQAKAIRSELKSNEDVKISADVHVFSINEWEERKQHSDLVKGWGILLGASVKDVNRTWIVKHREVILVPVRFQFYVNNSKVYDVALLSDEDKSRIRSVGGTSQDFNAWSNVPNSELTVDSYLEYHNLGITELSDYEEIVQLNIGAKELSVAKRMGKTLEELKILKTNDLELTELADIQKVDVSLDDLLLLKKNSLSIDDFRTIRNGGGNIPDFLTSTESGCKDISEYLRSISMQIPIDKYTYLCKQGVALDDYQKLSQNRTSFEEYKTYSDVKPVTIDEYLVLKNDNISLENYRRWAPYIESLNDYKSAAQYDFLNFLLYNRIKPLNFIEYTTLRESSVSQHLYQEWSSTASTINQYPIIANYKADHQEYRWFQTYDKSFADYLTELKSGWRDTKNYKEFKRDLHRKYLYPERKKSFFCLLTGGACVGAGFILHAISSTYYDNSNNSYSSYRQNPNSSTWSSYKSDYDTYMYLLRAGDISFYAAGGFAIISGFTFFIKKDNPHYIAQVDRSQLKFTLSPTLNGLGLTMYLKGGSK
jgi:hypothetical protein